MVTVEIIRDRAKRIWLSQDALRAELRSEPYFPQVIRVGRPSARVMGDSFAILRKNSETLQAHAKSKVGKGYEVEFSSITYKTLGEQQVPTQIVIPSLEDLAYLANETSRLKSFRKCAGMVLDAEPSLREWCIEKPFRLTDHAEDWPQLLSVLAFFRENAYPGRYIRQLEIEGVDSKFIEGRKKIIDELLSFALGRPPVIGETFESKFGLLAQPTMIHFRRLDPGGRFEFRNLTVPVVEFAGNPQPENVIIIVENKITAIAFPDLSDALVVFGSGYGVPSLRQVTWLSDKQVFYWGDIDTNGFKILASLRMFLPNARSLLMDDATLREFSHLKATEKTPVKLKADELNLLTPTERALYEAVIDGDHGPGFRLEQERLPYSRAFAAMKAAGCLRG